MHLLLARFAFKSFATCNFEACVVDAAGPESCSATPEREDVKALHDILLRAQRPGHPVIYFHKETERCFTAVQYKPPCDANGRLSSICQLQGQNHGGSALGLLAAPGTPCIEWKLDDFLKPVDTPFKIPIRLCTAPPDGGRHSVRLVFLEQASQTVDLTPSSPSLTQTQTEATLGNGEGGSSCCKCVRASHHQFPLGNFQLRRQRLLPLGVRH